MISPNFIETLPAGIPRRERFFAAPETRCGDDFIQNCEKILPRLS